MSHVAAAMISATPALSSAPSSVVPSEVTMSWPTRSARSALVAGESTGAAREHDLAAVVVAPDLRVDARRGRVRARVDVRDEADGRAVVAADRLERREDVAVLGQLDVGEPEPAELVGEEPREVELLGRARIGLRRRDPTACRCARSERAGRGRPRRARRRAAIRTGPPRPESLRAAPAQTRRAPT